jgi:hypothetical protein
MKQQHKEYNYTTVSNNTTMKLSSYDNGFVRKAKRLDVFLQTMHCYPSIRDKGNSESKIIGVWVAQQRKLKRRNMLSPFRISVLKGVDPCFFSVVAVGTRMRDNHFRERAEELKVFLKTNECYPSICKPKYSGSKTLGGWVAKQRQYYGELLLSPVRIAILKGIDPYFFCAVPQGSRIHALDRDRSSVDIQLSNTVARIPAKQCASNRSPRMPPSWFEEVPRCNYKTWKSIDHKHLDKASAMCMARKKKKEKSSTRTKRKYIPAALYGELYTGYKLIDVSGAPPSGGVDIEVTLADGTKSVVEIGSAASEIGMLEELVSLGKVLPTRGNARPHAKDVGDMFGLGWRSPTQIYKPTKTRAIADAMEAASTSVGNYMKKYWRRAYHNIREAERTKSKKPLRPLREMGGKDGPGNVIMVSRNLGNSAHIDFNDRTRSFGVWFEEVPGQAKNWYFILPDVSIDGSDGVVIKLFHGAIIAWDGSKVRHCSSMSDPGDNNNVFGSVFASCR